MCVAGTNCCSILSCQSVLFIVHFLIAPTMTAQQKKIAENNWKRPKMATKLITVFIPYIFFVSFIICDFPDFWQNVNVN